MPTDLPHRKLTTDAPTPVLVVDDEAPVRALVTRWLAQEGCHRSAEAGYD